MTDYSGAINDLRFFENRLKNILEVIPVLTELGSLDNAVNEAKKRIDDLKADIADLDKAKADAEQALAEDKRTLEARKDDFDAWHKNEVEIVNKESKLLLKEAQDKAANIIAVATAKAEEIAKDSEENKAVLEDLLAKIAVANKQYSDIQDKLQSIKASL